MSLLEACNIGVRIGGRAILDDVSARFEPAKVTAIVGPNGAGKSTLLDCIAQLRRPDSGTVHLNGVNLARLDGRQRARHIGYLPQQSEIAWAVDGETFVGLGRTPYQGAWGLSQEDRSHVEQAMVTTGTWRFRHRVVSTLSGGERARVLLARALAGQPEWLLADEPLAGLDPGHVLDVAGLFKALASDQGCGILVTLHDLDAAMRMADRIIVLAAGRVLADGAPLEALSPDILRQAYGVDSQLIEGRHGPVLEIIGRAG